MGGAVRGLGRSAVIPRVGQPRERVGAHHERGLGKDRELLHESGRPGEPERAARELGGPVPHLHV
ncbi:MAG: hypothetical protein ACK56I_04265, partial [bacterium]